MAISLQNRAQTLELAKESNEINGGLNYDGGRPIRYRRSGWLRGTWDACISGSASLRSFGPAYFRGSLAV